VRRQSSRRPQIVAALLSAALVVCILLPLLGGNAWLPAMGMMRDRFASSVGSEHELPAPPTRCLDIERVMFGGYRFSAACAGQAPSFDRRFYVVKNAGMLTGVGLVRGGSGASLDDLGELDGVPFTLFWSPSSYRFFANRKHDDGLDRLHAFDVRGTAAIELPALTEAAAGVLRERRPCMTAEDIGVSGVRWGRDGRRIAMLVSSRHAACGGTGGWRPLWMVGDALTGQVDPQSIRTRGRLDPLPADGPYATL
jgi:hypothetical protein